MPWVSNKLINGAIVSKTACQWRLIYITVGSQEAEIMRSCGEYKWNLC